MQTTANNLWTTTVVAVILVSAFPVFGATQQNFQQAGSSTVISGSDISATTENGQTTVIYKGKQVFTGPTTGQVSTRCNNDNGNEYAAAFDGDKVIWENRSGAAKRLKKMGGKLSHPNNLLERFKTDHPTGADANISVTSDNGQTKVVYKGQEVFNGPTTGQVSAQAINDNGQEYAAAFAGDKVIWENTLGAASHLKQSAGSHPAGSRQL